MEGEEGKNFKKSGKDIFIIEIAVFCTMEYNY